MEIDLDELTQRWQQAWLHCPPFGHLLRGRFGDRWVRFHSLPESRRYPHTNSDYAILLMRHNAILRELQADETYLITVGYPEPDLAAHSQPIMVGLHPAATRWMTAEEPDDTDATPVDFYASRVTYTPGCLDALLRRVADDQASGVIIADRTMRWLYHPYDGGADVIAPSTAARDRLRQSHPDWLSTHPHGL